jgi:hypothetical protein
MSPPRRECGKRKWEAHQKGWYAVHGIPRCMRSPSLCGVCLRETRERVCRPLSCFNILRIRRSA